MLPDKPGQIERAQRNTGEPRLTARHEGKMIRLKRCRELLDKEGKKYTDEQLEQIRQFLTTMARLNIEIIKNKNRQDEESSDHVQG